jgi:hypothetical protein
MIESRVRALLAAAVGAVAAVFLLVHGHSQGERDIPDILAAAMLSIGPRLEPPPGRDKVSATRSPIAGPATENATCR